MSNLMTIKLLALMGAAFMLGAVLYYGGKLRALEKAARYAPPCADLGHEFQHQSRDTRRFFLYWLGWLLALSPFLALAYTRSDLVRTLALAGAMATISAVVASWLRLRIESWVRERQRRYFAFMDENGWIDDSIGE